MTFIVLRAWNHFLCGQTLCGQTRILLVYFRPQVRIKWTLLLRLLTFVGYSTLYARSGLIAYPWLQAAGMTISCILVSNE